MSSQRSVYYSPAEHLQSAEQVQTPKPFDTPDNNIFAQFQQGNFKQEWGHSTPSKSEKTEKTEKTQKEFNFDDFGNYDENQVNRSDEVGQDSQIELQQHLGIALGQSEPPRKGSRDINDLDDLVQSSNLQQISDRMQYINPELLPTNPIERQMVLNQQNKMVEPVQYPFFDNTVTPQQQPNLAFTFYDQSQVKEQQKQFNFEDDWMNQSIKSSHSKKSQAQSSNNQTDWFQPDIQRNQIQQQIPPPQQQYQVQQQIPLKAQSSGSLEKQDQNQQQYLENQKQINQAQEQFKQKQTDSQQQNNYAYNTQQYDYGKPQPIEQKNIESQKQITFQSQKSLDQPNNTSRSDQQKFDQYQIPVDFYNTMPQNQFNVEKDPVVKSQKDTDIFYQQQNLGFPSQRSVEQNQPPITFSDNQFYTPQQQHSRTPSQNFNQPVEQQSSRQQSQKSLTAVQQQQYQEPRIQSNRSQSKQEEQFKSFDKNQLNLFELELNQPPQQNSRQQSQKSDQPANNFWFGDDLGVDFNLYHKDSQPKQSSQHGSYILSSNDLFKQSDNGLFQNDRITFQNQTQNLELEKPPSQVFRVEESMEITDNNDQLKSKSYANLSQMSNIQNPLENSIIEEPPKDTTPRSQATEQFLSAKSSPATDRGVKKNPFLEDNQDEVKIIDPEKIQQFPVLEDKVVEPKAKVQVPNKLLQTIAEESPDQEMSNSLANVTKAKTYDETPFKQLDQSQDEQRDPFKQFDFSKDISSKELSKQFELSNSLKPPESQKVRESYDVETLLESLVPRITNALKQHLDQRVDQIQYQLEQKIIDHIDQKDQQLQDQLYHMQQQIENKLPNNEFDKTDYVLQKVEMIETYLNNQNRKLEQIDNYFQKQEQPKQSQVPSSPFDLDLENPANPNIKLATSNVYSPWKLGNQQQSRYAEEENLIKLKTFQRFPKENLKGLTEFEIQQYKRQCKTDRSTLLETYELLVYAQYDWIDEDKSHLNVQITYRNKASYELNNFVVIVSPVRYSDKFECSPYKISQLSFQGEITQDLKFYNYDPYFNFLPIMIRYQLNNYQYNIDPRDMGSEIMKSRNTVTDFYVSQLQNVSRTQATIGCFKRSFNINLPRPPNKFIQFRFVTKEEIEEYEMTYQSDPIQSTLDELIVYYPWLVRLDDHTLGAKILIQSKEDVSLIMKVVNLRDRAVIQINKQDLDQRTAEHYLSFFNFIF